MAAHPPTGANRSIRNADRSQVLRFGDEQSAAELRKVLPGILFSPGFMSVARASLAEQGARHPLKTLKRSAGFYS